MLRSLACCVRVQAWATGDNEYGRLGLGDYTARSTPEQLLSPTNIVQVAAGQYHTVLVDGSGLVRASCFVCLSLATESTSEWCLSVWPRLWCSLLRALCAGVWESLSRAWEDSLPRTVVIICVARSRLIAPTSYTACCT